ncbi:ribose transport system ATP-binding protein [Sporomusaceae bacterium BoRhaA]|uniref:sugar ABC transporter ATP-binding protein n=1 Tax=Pelorhabdus rhamnosifermentans TaxID=2772457 RepID=UPI001C05FE82|nr:sugar ABC transporter ATP-binding protein [Pelorhabdus rhamnosifermentans]MBU2702227.1 ribose transport system ATP-binding protein [Pelorhabdus rhamnosifermentans]
MTNEAALLTMKGITKTFPGVKALDKFDFVLKAGEVHALLGENGAGKSTLMKVLSGVYQADEGEILLNGMQVKLTSPRSALDLGIGIIHQELNLIPGLTVMENIYLGREPKKFGVVDFDRMRQKTKQVLDELGTTMAPETLVADLSIGEQQLVEIAKALSYASRILIMDEPTTALTETETSGLFATIERLTEKGLAIVYISHRMGEIFRICHRVTVMRDGKYVGTVVTAGTTFEELIRMMVGRELSSLFPKESVVIGEEVLKVENLSSAAGLQDVSFSLCKGEILGVAGLMGSGRSELARALFGADPMTSGTIALNGQRCNISGPQDAIDAGIGLITEDRKQQGLVLEMSVGQNMSLASLRTWSPFGVIHEKEEKSAIAAYIKQLNIRTPSAEKLVNELSGGNQQKVVIAKWLATQPKVLIMDEPTRGVDVGAKAEIYQIMNMLVTQGVGILMISSELPEVLGMSDRVLVMQGGKLAAILPIEQATQESIMAYAAGGEGGDSR